MSTLWLRDTTLLAIVPIITTIIRWRTWWSLSVDTLIRSVTIIINILWVAHWWLTIMTNVTVRIIVIVVESAKESTAADVVVGADWCLCSAHGAILLHPATSDAAVLEVLVVVLLEGENG